MARPARFSPEDILDAAAGLAARDGPARATVAAIATSLGAPTGSIYHRFRSKDVLLAEIWTRAIESFQVGFQAALAGEDPFQAGLEAALHTPRWVRAHPVSARLLLLYHREDFLTGEWPCEVLERVSRTTRRAQVAVDSFARHALGSASEAARRRARFAVVDAPVAAVLPHVRAGERPPKVVDELVADAFRGVMGPGA